MSIEKIEIHTDYIKLEQLIKFSGFCVTGGEAKNIILNNNVFVNDQPCSLRGKKLYDKDIIEIKIDNKSYKFQVLKTDGVVYDG